ncbi:MAG: heavy-metal-associated domain-containing protein [Candidatus Cloacimonetes bacterium]|nr:heavy-metal-associated domain-containing protein [Candidatus Cloacimonadota bacterium]
MLDFCTETIKIEGMSCGHCSSLVKESLLKLQGVKDVTVSLEEKHAVIVFTQDFSRDKAIEVITDLGFEVM